MDPRHLEMRPLDGMHDVLVSKEFHILVDRAGR